MPLFRQMRAAFIRPALEGLNDFLAKHFIDFRCEARGAWIAHPRRLGCCRDRAKLGDILHQLSFAAAKSYSAWRNDFEAKFERLTHDFVNTMQYGAGQ